MSRWVIEEIVMSRSGKAFSDPVESAYNPTVMDHFHNPRNVGEAKNANAVASVLNDVCGDMTKLSLRIENGRIAEARFKTFGCGAAIASASMTTVLLAGKTIEEAAKLTNLDVVAALGGLPEPKVKCSVTAEQAVRGALQSYAKGS